MEGFNWSILGWLGAVIFVYIFGIFEGRSQGRKKRIAEEQAENKQNQPQVETITIDDPGILRVKNENGSYQLDLDGERLAPTDLTSFHRRRLINILNALRPWVEDKQNMATTQPPVPPAPKPVTYSPPAPVVSVSPRPPVTSTQTAPPSNPLSAAINMLTTPKAKDPELEAAPTSIVGQINLILQERIRNTPLEAKNISLSESFSGGVNVSVGDQRFEGVEDVTDAEVKLAIRGAIAEWERRYTPGMK